MLVREEFNMEEEKYINIIEKSSVDGSLIKKWISMNIIKKYLLEAMSPTIKSIQESNEELERQNKELSNQISDLSKSVSSLVGQMSTLSEQVRQNSRSTSILVAEYNTKKASASSKYKNAIDELFKLKMRFEQNIGYYGRAKKLDLLQMLVNYLYEPQEALKNAIISHSEDDAKTSQILDEIDKFNSEYKKDLISYLSSIESTWDDCVIFPKEFFYNSKTMSSFNDNDIEEGAPIYVVSLGCQFPNSNSESTLPLVFKQNKSKEI